MIRSRWGRRNPLIRRIQRHALISALFGKSTPVIERMPSRQLPRKAAGEGFVPLQETRHTPWSRPVPVVTAWLAPTPPPDAGEYGVLGEEVTRPSLTALPLAEPFRSQPSASTKNVEEAPAERVRPKATAGLQPVVQKQPVTKVERPHLPSGGLTSSPVQAEPKTSSQETKAEIGTPPLEEDPIWKRLQTIFRKHEEKRREEGAHQGDAQIEPVPEQTPALQPEEVKRTPAETRASTKKAISEQDVTDNKITSPIPEGGLQRQIAEPPTRLAPEETESVEEDAGRSGAPEQEPDAMTIILPEAGRMENDADAAAINVAAMQKPLETIPPEAEEEVVARTEATETKAAETKSEGVEGRSDQLAAKEFTTSDATVKQAIEQKTPARKEILPGVTQAEDQATVVDDEVPRGTSQILQTLPLEKVWPVERQTSEGGRQEPRAYPSEEPIPEILAQEEQAQVREALREVSPGQPTDSPVEMITPRKPRPSPVISTPAVMQEKERQSAPSQTPASLPSESGIEETELSVKSPEAIETEIGPLPSDLWELIGEKPEPGPSQDRQALAPAESREPVMPDETRLRGEAELPSETGHREGPSARKVMFERERSPETVQRQPSPQQAAEPAPTGGQATEAAGAAKPPAELDMDELVARVYGEVKKRLGLEWERLRRRF